jgi:signal transduction histidine kinase
MGWTTQQRVRAGFWLLTLAPLLLGFVAARNAYELADAARDVARTNELVKKLENLLSNIKDVEVAQREYILSGDRQYVEEIVSARQTIRNSIDQIGTMRADPRWLELLKTAIPQKFDEIAKTIESRQAGGVEAASQVIEQNRGRQAMDDIRRIIHNMITEENRLLDQRSAAQNDRLVTTIILFGIMLVITVTLIWFLFYLIRREDDRIRRANEELEQFVALRTQELQRSNEDLQQFAYVASHDMKEPLRMIASYSTLLQRRYQGRLDADADTYIGFITDGTKRMNQLITDLLEYSRAGQTNEDERVQVEPSEVLSTVLTNLKVTIAETRAIVTADELPPVLYDPTLLCQLLQNLIANGIKYRSQEAPRVHVSARRDQGEIIFSVQDNGQGIPPEHQEQIFAIFKRLHGVDVEGTGIGLAMCKKIVERNGGRIWVESEPGAGSTFYFTIPERRSAAEATA